MRFNFYKRNCKNDPTNRARTCGYCSRHFAKKCARPRSMGIRFARKGDGKTVFRFGFGDYRRFTKFENNRPVADFFCSNCDEQFELKSKAGLSNGRKVPDGTYNTMISRIQADDNPNFFFLAYKKADYSVQQLILVPKHFVTVEMIVPRKRALKDRPNYLMCDMNISSLPESGKIHLIDKA